MSEPELDAPGAGPSKLQLFLLRYIVKPFTMRQSKWHNNWIAFDDVNTKINHAIDGLTEEQLGKRVLIDPFFGIEDNSRYWSITMTLEHIAIVNEGLKALISALGQGKVPEAKIDVAAVKPSPTTLYTDAVSRYKDSIKDIRKDMAAAFKASKDEKAIRKLTKEHPWFGDMTLTDWQWLLAIHTQIHYKQIKLIKEKL